MIAIVDYGLGNVKAFANIYRRLGIPHKITSKPEELECSDGIILPGVGAFDWAMKRLNQSGFRNCLDYLILEKKRPFLGVCVGMQILANDSEEGQLPGLGWLGGAVKIMSSENFGDSRILPHMGWNTVSGFSRRGLFSGLEDPEFYFCTPIASSLKKVIKHSQLPFMAITLLVQCNLKIFLECSFIRKKAMVGE